MICLIRQNLKSAEMVETIKVWFKFNLYINLFKTKKYFLLKETSIVKQQQIAFFMNASVQI